MSPRILNAQPLDSYDEAKLHQKVLFEYRQQQLDALYKLTGEIVINQYPDPDANLGIAV